MVTTGNDRVLEVDLGSILPWDVETITESIYLTDRLFIVHEAGMTVSVSGKSVPKRCKRRVFQSSTLQTKELLAAAGSYVSIFIPDASLFNFNCNSVALEYENFMYQIRYLSLPSLGVLER